MRVAPVYRLFSGVAEIGRRRSRVSKPQVRGSVVSTMRVAGLPQPEAAAVLFSSYIYRLLSGFHVCLAAAQCAITRLNPRGKRLGRDVVGSNAQVASRDC